MNEMQKLLEQLRQINPFSKGVIRLGAYLMLCFYIVALTAYHIAPHCPNYFQAMTLYQGGLEAAPASLAAGVCAGLLCDIILASQRK